MLSSLDKLPNNLSKDHFRETRKCLGSFCIQQPNQPQTNNVTEGGEEGEAMHVYEDYQNYRYKLPIVTSDQQQQMEEDLVLMTWKGVHPFEYMDFFEWFQESQLPPKDAFYSSLTEEYISETDYIYAQRVFTFYYLTNVLLLADVFENFRGVRLQDAHNYSSSGLSWEAALRIVGVELDLLTNIDQQLFINQGISGWVAMISHQYVHANTPGMDNYDASRSKSYIMYQDTNNLYGWTMSQPLPTPNFKWLKEKEMEELDMMMVPDNSNNSRGHILDCDLGIFSVICIFIYIS